ncbi:hypothetical protein ACEYYB_06730 [Paracoccus sp. p4-l81]|uniref:hypothetical protein n=1 Tax=unclassified Paracoccus (in: a-proteobacteria) TaxID=2688777 RepID=UPI0035BAE1C6
MSQFTARHWIWMAAAAAALPVAALAQQTTDAPAADAPAAAPAAEASPYLYIAGVKPWERPAGAPVITEYVKSPEWYANALFGVSEPYPASLGFLEDQGGWWTPFNHPGMPGPYDIRGWHAAN